MKTYHAVKFLIVSFKIETIGLNFDSIDINKGFFFDGCSPRSLVFFDLIIWRPLGVFSSQNNHNVLENLLLSPLEKAGAGTAARADWWPKILNTFDYFYLTKFFDKCHFTLVFVAKKSNNNNADRSLPASQNQTAPDCGVQTETGQPARP